VSSAQVRAGPGWKLSRFLGGDSAARAALVLGAAGLASIPLDRVALPAGTTGQQIYASALATGCGLVTLLLLEEQLLGRPGPRQLGLCGTFLVLSAMAVAWATSYAPGVRLEAGFVSARLAWYLALAVGLALSLGTPGWPWEWVAQRLRRSTPVYALVAGSVGIVVGGTAVLGSMLMSGLGHFGPAVDSSWLSLAASGVLLTVVVGRWSLLSPTERWTLTAGILAADGLLVNLAGGGGGSVGGGVGWLETAAGVGLLIGVLSSHMYSAEHRLLVLETAERDLLRQMVHGTGGGGDPAAAGLRVCRELVRLRGITTAHVLSIGEDEGAVPVAAFPPPPDGYPAQVGLRLPEQRSRDLSARAAVGPWIESTAAAARQAEDPRLREYWMTYTRLGIGAFAYAPIRRHGTAVGLLVAGMRGGEADAASDRLLELLPSLTDFATALAGPMAPLLDRGADGGRLGVAVRRALEKGDFYPVFQPIVDLAGGELVGYEALTRFAGEMAPDAAFRAAAGAGIQRELELATLRRALRQGASLVQPGQFLSLNVSPAVLVAAGGELGRLLHRRRHDVVVEITEHSEVADYDELRAAVGRFGPRVRLAVDDAGAGYSSLRHILELRPSFVKLDLSLVQGMERDPAREALAAGMQHFAERSGFRLIAEGIENQSELAQLRSLGVGLGQGYLLGRPLPLAGARRLRVPASHLA
jgi:EAL domain-containing protein (putative c-di-GMP-specific phosphodiesterase class I)